MATINLSKTLRQGRSALSQYRIQAATLALIMSGLASVNILASSSFIASMLDTPYFQILLATNELLALALALYAAYKWDTTLGAGSILLFLSLVAPSLSTHFLSNFPKLFHLQLIALITLFGIWLIGELQRSLHMTQQREREISAIAGLNAQVLNERAQLMEDASKGRSQITNLLKTVCLSGLTGGPLNVAGTFLDQVQGLINSDFACFSLINNDGSLGERIDNCKNKRGFHDLRYPFDLEQAVVENWNTQYVINAENEERSYPSLIASGIRSALVLPIKTDRRLVGILSFYSQEKDAFNGDKDFLESFSSLLAGPIMRAELCHDVANITQETQVAVNTSVAMWR